MILAHNLNKKLFIENLALRQQLMVMRLSVKRPKIRKRDRLFWVILSRLWKGWKIPLVVVQPETVIRCQRKGFKLFWTPKSRKNRTGRPPVDPKTRQLIKILHQPIHFGELQDLRWAFKAGHWRFRTNHLQNTQKSQTGKASVSDLAYVYRESYGQYFFHRFLHRTDSYVQDPVCL